MSSVSIVTCTTRISEGQFRTDIDSVWASPEDARAELTRIKNIHKRTPCTREIRAKHPIGQPDDLTVEMKNDDSWETVLFYKLVTKDIQTHK